MFWKKKKSPSQQVTSGRFELERDGNTAYLEYTIAGNVLALLHTEVPPELRRHGVASSLAKTALDWARENGKKVDVICPSVADYIDKHPEYRDVVLR
jgi:predicted GNAT family acetyltransferase